jgi:RimJ/RimL family protein N-acetyltransferase
MLLVKGKHISFFTVEVTDAQFILDLRLNEKKNKFMARVDNDLQKQIDWLISYKLREAENKEYYFKAVDKNNNNLGVARIYDFIDDSFYCGSWMSIEGCPIYAAIEAIILLYEYAFYKLGFNKARFGVRKGSDNVIAFHKRFGAKIVGEDDDNYYFNFKKEDYELIKIKYSTYLP